MADYRTNAEKESADRFPRDTAGHELTILHDDGLYRHLRFMAPQRGAYWFDLITLPDGLIFRGDGESFVFTILRAGDLFDLFRRSRDNGSINPGYWSEKLSSERDAATDYSRHLFDEEVTRDLAEAETEWPGVTEAWNEHVGEWSDYNTEYESEARRALDDFEFGKTYTAKCSCGAESPSYAGFAAAMAWERKHAAPSDSGHQMSVEPESFRFHDTYEWDLRDYAWWFLWACHGISWGIKQYDAAKAAKQVAA